MPTQVVTVVSHPVPLEGQEHRSSDKFHTGKTPPGSSRFIWKVTQNGRENDEIRFNVMKHRSLFGDRLAHYGIGNNSKTPVQRHRALYIADPVGSNEAFQITVYAE